MQDYEKLGVFYLGRAVDPSGTPAPDVPILYDSKDLTTHAVCMGMTGSGKTGLCLALLEEAAIDGIPAICIDPKGDLGNLLLTFPDLAANDFAPWVDTAEAARKGQSAAEYAAQTAATWKKGLEQWDQGADRIKRLRDTVDLAIYTPGTNTGLPLAVLRSFAAPGSEFLNDTTALRDRIGTLVSGLLALLGRDADPLQSREHVLLANIVEHAWRDGVSLDLASLIAAIQKPPFDRIGAFELETFFPAKERLALAMALNTLLAAPGFASWLQGEPLDAQRLLFTPEGKPRISIISIAHLSDTERMFIVTLVLNELIAWMRTQSGTSSLRAVFYMDEIFGYFPPTAAPPSKQPMLTLLKQARAFGLGCVLATQNPVDLDYKGLSNCGTWFIGRLQTDRDKMRVIDGLESALAGAGSYDRTTLDKMLSALAPRLFLMRNTHDDAAVLFQSRWALSYLRGPLTGPEISRLMASRKDKATTAPAAQATPTDIGSPRAIAAGAGESTSRPAVPATVAEYFQPASGGSGALVYKPAVAGFVKLHFVDAKLALDQWQSATYIVPLSERDTDLDWNQADVVGDLRSTLTRTPTSNATFGALPAMALRADSYSSWKKSLSAWLYENSKFEVLVCDALKATSAPGESEGDFRARLALAAREKRDAAAAELRRKYAPKEQTLLDRERRAQERVSREQSQLSQQKLQTAFSVGASILGAFLGRKRISATNLNRVASAARSAGRIGQESGDVDRAGESLEAVKQQRADLQRQFETDLAALDRGFDASTVAVRSVAVSPRKSDIEVSEVALLWRA